MSVLIHHYHTKWLMKSDDIQSMYKVSLVLKMKQARQASTQARIGKLSQGNSHGGGMQIDSGSEIR